MTHEQTRIDTAKKETQLSMLVHVCPWLNT